MSLEQRVLSGESLEGLDVIDAHMHLNHPPFYVPASGWEAVVERMDRYGIARGISAPQLAITCGMEEGNTEILEVTRRTDRLLAYCTVNPHYGPERILAEMERCFAAGAVAVKIHPGVHRVPIHDERYHPVYRYAADTGRVILAHTWGGCPMSSPRFCAEMAGKFGVRFILGHAGGTLEGLKETIDAVRRKPDLLVADLTGSRQFFGRVETLCREISAERVVFGSDSPWMEPGFALGAVIFADVSEEEKRLILSGNIKRLLGFT